jgi:hypothetical protein
VPVDERFTWEVAGVAELADYIVTLNGHETTMRLTPAHAEQLGARPADTAAAPDENSPKVQHKARRPADKARAAD